MMRILVMTHAGGSPSHGPNMRWYYLGQALKQIGVDVEIVSSSSFHKYTSPTVVHAGYSTEEVNGIKYHWLKTRPYSRRGFSQVVNQLEYVRSCYRHHQHFLNYQPDIVLASSPHPFVVFPARKIAKKCGARLVYEVRDLWPELLLELGSFGRWHPYILMLKFAERYGLKYSDHIISVKPGDYDYFKKEYNLPVECFSYIPNGFLPEASPHSAPEVVLQVRNRYRFLLGYVGALSAYYSLDRLINLSKEFSGDKDIAFVVVGKGDYAEMLKLIVDESGLDNVFFIGPISKSQVDATLSEFDACYVGLEDLAVHRYGISCNKIYEYMHAGKPIIGSYSAGHDPVKAAQCGFVAPPGDYATLVDAIKELKAHPERARLLGKNGREYFDANHNFRVVAYRLKEVLFSNNGIFEAV